MVVSEELSCGEVAGAPKLVPFSFSFFLFRFDGKEKILRWNFGCENENEKEIRFRFRNLAKKLAQDAKFCVTETKKKFVSVFVRKLQQPECEWNDCSSLCAFHQHEKMGPEVSELITLCLRLVAVEFLFSDTTRPLKPNNRSMLQ